LKKNKTYIIFLIVAIVIYVLAEYYKPKELDWTMSFSKEDKIPFGTYILYNLLDDELQVGNLQENKISIYDFFEENNPINTNFIFINYNFEITDIELYRILNYAKTGNAVFISAAIFSKNIKDSLNFSTYFKFSEYDSLTLFLQNPIFENKNYYYNKAFEQNYIAEFDTINTIVLGKDNSDLVNFIKIKYGEGYFLINTQPLTFTNYNLLITKNYEYAFKSLSYLENTTTYWDEYFKIKNYQSTSPLNVILKSKSFKSAYYLSLITLLIYMIFMGKRRQRIVPVIKPLANTSLEFNELIARLYLHSRNHKDVVNKRFKYFLEFLRTKYNINQITDNKIFIQTISEKTNVKIDEVKQIFTLKSFIENSDSVDDEFLFKFNNSIENFYKQVK